MITGLEDEHEMESENKNNNELSVYITDVSLTFEEKVGNEWVPFSPPAVVSCSLLPGVPLLFGPDNPAAIPALL